MTRAPHTPDPVDYPDVAAGVARAVVRGEADAGIVIDGAGIGSAIAANKLPGIRAVMALTPTIARYSREHNGANVLTLGASLLTEAEALEIVSTWLATPMREPRYIRRLTKIRDLERRARPVGPDRMTREELQHLVDIIVQEMAARRVGAGDGRCSCHAVRHDCCPDRLRGVVDAGATRVGVHAGGGAPDGIAHLIDHTMLKPDAARKDIEELCREAAKFKFATVCVNPVWVALAAQQLAGTGVLVCSVVGFPLGATTPDVKGYETRRAIFDGAREIDTVINIGALKSGDLRLVERDIEAVVEPCRDCGALSKVIIEAALLTDDEKVTACTLAKAAGADYVKTSTGFGPGGATPADVALMRRVVGADMGVKAAGGVRDLASLKALVAAGATRVGASAGVKIVQEARK